MNSVWKSSNWPSQYPRPGVRLVWRPECGSDPDRVRVAGFIGGYPQTLQIPPVSSAEPAVSSCVRISLIRLSWVRIMGFSVDDVAVITYRRASSCLEDYLAVPVLYVLGADGNHHLLSRGPARSVVKDPSMGKRGMDISRFREGQLLPVNHERPSGNLFIAWIGLRIKIKTDIGGDGVLHRIRDLKPGPGEPGLVYSPDCYGLVPSVHDDVIGYLAVRVYVVSDVPSRVTWIRLRRHQRRPDGPVAVSVRRRVLAEPHRDGFSVGPGEAVVGPGESGSLG